VWDRLFAMFLVLVSGVFLILSSSLPGVIHWFIDTSENIFSYKVLAFILNILVCVAMFWLIHYFSPSKHPKKRDALKMGLISSAFFILGNMILGSYFRNYGLSSIYGAAGTLLVFLIWAYYSSFTLFLSVEVFLFYKRNKKLK
jgi:membrane protein